MDDLAGEQVRHGRQVDVRVRAHVQALPGRQAGRPEVIEEHERPDGAVARRGQQAPHHEPAEIPVARRQDRFHLGSTGSGTGVSVGSAVGRQLMADANIAIFVGDVNPTAPRHTLGVGP